MATIPIYDETILPCITYPMINKRKVSKRYLGNKGISGETYATVQLIAKTDSELAALTDFWLIDCNYGLEPFLIKLPMFGQEVTMPSILVKFIGDTSDSKNDDGTWRLTRELKILGNIVYIIDDNGDFITDDSGDFTITDDGDFISTENINTFRSVTTIIVQ